jgi:hypothetical protein
VLAFAKTISPKPNSELRRRREDTSTRRRRERAIKQVIKRIFNKVHVVIIKQYSNVGLKIANRNG